MQHPNQAPECTFAGQARQEGHRFAKFARYFCTMYNQNAELCEPCKEHIHLHVEHTAGELTADAAMRNSVKRHGL